MEGDNVSESVSLPSKSNINTSEVSSSSSTNVNTTQGSSSTNVNTTQGSSSTKVNPTDLVLNLYPDLTKSDAEILLYGKISSESKVKAMRAQVE